MKPLNILLIDDDASFGIGLKRMLEGLDHTVTMYDSPSKGIEAMNHRFDAVFIDHVYANRSETGADVGYAIRKMYPLAALVLMTAYWDIAERIQQFIWVGFDAFLPKKIEGDSSDQMRRNCPETLKKALENAQKRIQSTFTDTELADVKQRLDYMELAVTAGKVNRVNEVGVAVFLLENGCPITELEAKLERYGENRREFKYRDKRPPNQPNVYVSTYFKVYEKGKPRKQRPEWVFSADSSALKARQLFMNHLSEWPRTRNQHTTIKAFLKDFDIA